MDNDIDALVNELLTNPSEVAVMAGAGISIPAPTCLPSGYALSEAALKAVSDDFVRQLQSLTASKILLAQELGLYVGRQVDRLPSSGAPLPRPETIFQAYESVVGDEIVQSLTFMHDAFPNLVHGVIGALCDRGSAVLTTNFDRLIETCSNGGEVLHLHGHVADPSSIKATIDGITRPLSAKLTDKLKKFLQGKRVLLVFGYSGGDAFDVSPALKSIAKTIGLALVWVQHGGVGTPLDRGAHRLLSDWPCAKTAITCDTLELASNLADQLGLHPPRAPDTCAKWTVTWWLGRFVDLLRGFLPDDRSRAIAALAVLESLHVGRFTREYRHRVGHLDGLTVRQELAVRRSDARTACARGNYRLGVRITRDALDWLEGIRGAEVDIAEQRLLVVMNLRNFGQGDPFTYLRSVPPLVRTHAWVWRARHRIDHGRFRMHVWTDWVQLLWKLKFKWVARQLRNMVLELSDWDAEHRARLLVSDDAGKYSQEALDFSCDLEIPPGIVNAGRAKIQREMQTSPPDELERIAKGLITASKALGDIVGCGKNLLLLARIQTGRNMPEAMRCWRKAQWILSRVSVSTVTRVFWRMELLKVRRRIKSG